MAEEFVWWRDGIIYQIYPRSFADSNGDGIGDLNGITSQLDYLADLGVDALWLSPIYPSPDVDFGYDVSDYTAVDPKFGTMEDFDQLVQQAKARKIHIVMDLVMNHTSDQHPWFQQSRQGRDNPYRDYYLWCPPAPGGGAPNNWQSIFGGSGWEYEPQSGEYFFHMFCKQQPDVNWRNPKVRQEMLKVFRFWLEHGVDGFRLDVFNAYFKDETLRNNPRKWGIRPFDWQRHIRDIDQPEMLPLLGEIRQLLDEHPGGYAVGETFLGGAERAAGYVGPGLLQAAFDLTFMNCPWQPERFLNAIQRWENLLPEGAWPNYVLNNHDQPRSATRYGQGEEDGRLKVAAAMLLTLRGTPFLYYGEEIGMRNIPLARSDIRDPVGIRYWPLHNGRDGCRAPMQWGDGECGGFNTGKSWMKMHPDAVERNVVRQRENPASLLNFYRQLIAIRRATPALQQGMFMPLSFSPRRVLAYLRQTEEQTVLVALNFSRRRTRLVLGRTLKGGSWKLLLSSRRTEMPEMQDGLLPLLPNEALILAAE
jgi:alpha-glucosidase